MQLVILVYVISTLDFYVSLITNWRSYTFFMNKSMQLEDGSIYK